jgi:hypothetical protein
MFPIILVVHWLHAVHLMSAGDWCTHLAGRLFACTPARPHPGPIVLRVPRHEMVRLIHHGYECTRGARAWLCTPNQIPR